MDLVKGDLEILRKISEKSTVEEGESLKNNLIQIAINNSGIGLSAIQIGIPKRVAVIHFGKTWALLVNPVWTAEGTARLHIEEGCLSLPNIRLVTDRYETITVTDEATFLNPTKISGLLAVVIQHEVDHMNGMLILDRKWVQELQKMGRNERILVEKDGQRKSIKRKHLEKGWSFVKLESAI